LPNSFAVRSCAAVWIFAFLSSSIFAALSIVPSKPSPDDAIVAQHEELLGERIGEHRARRIAAGDHDVVEPVFFRQVQHGAPAGDHAYARPLGQRLLHRRERLLRVAAIAARDHQALLVDIGREVIVAVDLDRTFGFSRDDLGGDPPADPAPSEPGHDHVRVRSSGGFELRLAADLQGFPELAGEASMSSFMG
jgi:hypothetical protein